MRNNHDVKHEVLILTDGQSNCGRNATVEANELKMKDIDVYSLAIGRFTDSGQTELESYVTEVESHLFNVEDFHDLTLLVNKVIKFREQENLCVPFDVGK